MSYDFEFEILAAVGIYIQVFWAIAAGWLLTTLQQGASKRGL